MRSLYIHYQKCYQTEYKTSIDKINDNIIHSRPLKTVAGRANPNFKIFS